MPPCERNEMVSINNMPIPPRRQSEPDPAIVSALRYAKRNLWDGSAATATYAATYAYSEFICNALPDGAADTIASTVILPRLRAWCGDDSVTTFRQALHRVTYHFPADLSSEAVQAARHAWLDQLIAEFGGE